MASPNGSQPATKADLQALRSETKSEFQALRSDLEATKTELKGDVQRLAKAVVQTQAEVQSVKETMATKADVQRIMGAIDAFARKSEANDRAIILHGQAITEIQSTQKNHERRLTTLEKAD